MDFCWITLHVRNLEESIKFYHELLGLKIAQRFKAGEDTEIAFLGEMDKPKIELLHNKKDDVVAQAAGLSIGFQVDSLDKAMEYLKEKNIPIKSGPISPSPKTRFIFIEDPNGIVVQIVEQK
ncbi:putative ring-cleavage extradiol dioxygenase [Desulfitobacterium dichloroeliminans LMG P-21439]|uniref:Putative ring-cleavage extradiol dioxygenase n=1 Tax=Desulfitobacterium dichloroeliminans (strain LMG P-21439 / DCA1) TaxID=871963 RepID=L0F5E1_DESDL|nr:VOC family protein [Desulfitobacterium dichloroeliminans]AGA67881.1 putative ring-cleavage extradiol dioxygenase [Desulfitobacterium dichloroeliminans LMG P-21439]